MINKLLDRLADRLFAHAKAQWGDQINEVLAAATKQLTESVTNLSAGFTFPPDEPPTPGLRSVK